MSEGQKRKTALQEIKELRGAIEPSKNDVIAQRALDLAEYYLFKAENQAGHIQRLEQRNMRMKGKWTEVVKYTEQYDINGVKTWASLYQCQHCGFVLNAIAGHIGQYNFCPQCGADMRGGQDE